MDRLMQLKWLAAGVLIAAVALLFSGSSQDWKVTEEGLLQYSPSAPEFELGPPVAENNSTLYEVRFASRGAQMAALLRIPDAKAAVPGIVLLPGATVTKEREQGLAKYLSSLGYASITFDQRNLGAIDMQSDLQMFLKGNEPTEHKMVHDALVAAEILRRTPGIDPERIVYAGESNGGRFAIIASALDAKARGVMAISTCGYGIDAAISSGMLTDKDEIRFYRSIDPDTYLGKIPPRPLVMIHSRNDTIIDYQLALQTFARAFMPKALHAVNCARHGYCPEMNEYLEKELRNMFS